MSRRPRTFAEKFQRWADNHAPWSSHRVTEARRWLAAQTDWPARCPRCGGDVHPNHWHLGHAHDQAARPDLRWEPGNWRVEHPRCNSSAGAAEGNRNRNKKRKGNAKGNMRFLIGILGNRQNCGGGCIKAGQGHFIKLLEAFPARFAEWESNEEDVRQHIGKDVTILRSKGVPITLRELRERHEAKDEQLDLFDFGGCGCAID